MRPHLDISPQRGQLAMVLSLHPGANRLISSRNNYNRTSSVILKNQNETMINPTTPYPRLETKGNEVLEEKNSAEIVGCFLSQVHLLSLGTSFRRGQAGIFTNGKTKELWPCGLLVLRVYRIPRHFPLQVIWAV